VAPWDYEQDDNDPNISDRLWFTDRRTAVRREYTYNGETFFSIAQMARHYGINYECLKSRLRRRWTLERAITEPVRHHWVGHYYGSVPVIVVTIDRWPEYLERERQIRHEHGR
jgi:hypothetical protein